MSRKLIDGRMALLLGGQILVVILVFWLLVSRGGQKDYEAYRHAGNKLQAAGVLTEAAGEYEKYLESEELNNMTRSKVAFNLAQIYEEIGNIEAALSWYYKINIFDPGSENKDEATRKIVSLLEKMKKFSAAKYELAQGTKLGAQDNGRKGGVVIAKVEGKSIFLHQLEDEMDALPKEYREKFKGKQGKMQFLQKYIADELFVIRAKRLGYDRDPKVKKSLAQLEKQMLVQKVLGDELKKEVKIVESDIKNYFKANEDKYKQGKKKASYKKIKKQVSLDYQMEKTQAVYQKMIAELLKTENVEVFQDKVK